MNERHKGRLLNESGPPQNVGKGRMRDRMWGELNERRGRQDEARAGGEEQSAINEGGAPTRQDRRTGTRLRGWMAMPDDKATI